MAKVGCTKGCAAGELFDHPIVNRTLCGTEFPTQKCQTINNKIIDKALLVFVVKQNLVWSWLLCFSYSIAA